MTLVPICRPRYWFWDSAVLVQTLAVTASLVLATSLDAFYQLTITLMVLFISFALLAHCHPFAALVSQRAQVSDHPVTHPVLSSVIVKWHR